MMYFAFANMGNERNPPAYKLFFGNKLQLHCFMKLLDTIW